MFQDKDVICFLGDSITASGLWEAEIYQFLRHKYNLKCFNCGISGGSADKARHYLYRTCLTHNPDYVTVMFGINDIVPWFYSDACTDPDKEEKIKNSLAVHKENYEWLIRQIIAFDATPILIYPTPYDEFHERNSANSHCQRGMNECMAFVTQMAKKYDLRTIDFCTPFRGREPELINEDRVHPTPLGYHVMAQEFLFQLGFTEKADAETPFVMEDWNKKRYDAEQKLHRINYVEYCDIFHLSRTGHFTLAQKKQEAQKRLNARPDQNDFISGAYRNFIEEADFRPELEEELFRLTK